jgi:hypothetical protein
MKVIAQNKRKNAIFSLKELQNLSKKPVNLKLPNN